MCVLCVVVLLSPSEELFLLFSFEPEFDFCWSCPCKISAAGGTSRLLLGKFDDDRRDRFPLFAVVVAADRGALFSSSIGAITPPRDRVDGIFSSSLEFDAPTRPRLNRAASSNY